MKVLGLLGSFRTNGNSDILGKEALMGAEAAGAEVEVVRLTHRKINPCCGYGLCLFREEGCVMKDDVKALFEKMEAADAILLSAPCYFLESTAVVKQLIDRCWIMAHQGTLRGRYASVLVPYATRGWIPYAMLQPNILFAILGFHVIHRETFNIQGLGEAVHDREGIERARRVGKELAEAVKTKDPSYRSAPGLCPICQDWNIRILRDRKHVECPTCGIRGRVAVQDGKIDVVFDEEAFKDYRFDPEIGYLHFTYHIKPSKDYFMRTRAERKEMVRPYKAYLKTGGKQHG